MLRAFEIDRSEVTVAAYAACAAAGGCMPEGTDTTSLLPQMLSWNEAKAYCEYRSKRLPTEAEWEKAARGTNGVRFPWGNADASCDLADFGDCGLAAAPVGSFPGGASPYGALDMAGNLAEWVADWYGDYSSFTRSPDPTGPTTGQFKVLRGGAYDDTAKYLRASARFISDPSQPLFSTVRCAN
jgi:formylglycine-generating enzyme required for sulfatase activity